MDDKTFELITKMYSDFSKKFDKIDSELVGLNSRMQKLETRMQNLETSQKKIETTLENDIRSSLQALHEREAINSDKLDEHSKQLDALNSKFDYLSLTVNSQDKRLELVESSKRKKAK